MEASFDRLSARIRPIANLLRGEYGLSRLGNPHDPVDDIVYLCLSRMTQQTKYQAAYTAVRAAMPTWDQVADAAPADLATIIHFAGLAPTKAKQIGAMLREIRSREGCIDLTRLHELTDSETEQYLTSLPGVSRKTALCVMMYTLHRQVLPVDTHVWRVARRIQHSEARSWSENGGKLLGNSVPPELRMDVHVNFIVHGRSVCRARRPRCNSCVLTQLCDHKLHA